MAKRIVLLGTQEENAGLRPACEAVGLEAVEVPAEAGAEGAVEAARTTEARGVYASGAANWPAAVLAAQRLRFPHMPLSAEGNSALPGTWRTLLEMKACTLESIVAEDLDAAEAAVAALGAPCWLRSLDCCAAPRCLVLEHANDLPLLFLKARGRGEGAAVLVQRPLEGEVWRVAGFRRGRDFQPVEAYQAWMRGGAFRLADRFGLGVSVCGAPYGAMLSLSRKAAAALPPGHGPVQVEMVLGDAGPVLTDIRVYPGIPPELDALFSEGLGLGFQEDALRVATGDAPLASPGLDIGAAVLWFEAPAGVVARIEGADAAKALPGVRQVVLRAQGGDTVGHVTDPASRRQLGYVVAVGPSLAEATARAEAARATVKIETRPVR